MKPSDNEEIIKTTIELLIKVTDHPEKERIFKKYIQYGIIFGYSDETLEALKKEIYDLDYNKNLSGLLDEEEKE